MRMSVAGDSCCCLGWEILVQTSNAKQAMGLRSMNSMKSVSAMMTVQWEGG